MDTKLVILGGLATVAIGLFVFNKVEPRTYTNEASRDLVSTDRPIKGSQRQPNSAEASANMPLRSETTAAGALEATRRKENAARVLEAVRQKESIASKATTSEKIHSRYQSFVDGQKLSAEEGGRVLDVLVRMEETRNDLAIAEKQYEIDDPDEKKALRDNIMAPLWAELKDVLGPNGMESFREYERDSFYRVAFVEPFAGILSSKQIALSNTQEADLTKIVEANGTVVPSKYGSGESVIDWQTVLRQSSGILTQQQLKALRKHVDQNFRRPKE